LLDDEAKGVAAYLDAAMPNVEALWCGSAVGKPWEAVVRRRPDARRVARNGLFFWGATPRALAHDCLEGPAEARRRFAPYVNIFARFFAQGEEGLVVERLCNAFLANESLHGSLNTVFRAVASTNEADEAEGDARFWLWDVMSSTFRRDRALAILRFAGICRPVDDAM
jgi:hypothetical protein